MKAIILAGGFGTRLKHIVSDVPKPMADINGKPFLQVLIDELASQGFDEFIISVHYMREKIIEYFANDSRVKFAIEESPLGTGGAIINSINATNLSGDVAIINGDTFLKLDYKSLFAQHNQKLSLALRKVEDTARYGRVEVNGEIITGFSEKGIAGEGLINAGNYVINCEWLKQHSFPEAFSFEADFMLPEITSIQPRYIVTDGYFIDIGVPEDYARAQNDLSNGF